MKIKVIIFLIIIMLSTWFVSSAQMIDTIVLQERKYPIYYNYLSPGSANVYYVDPNCIDTSNKLLNRVQSRNVNGVTIYANSDGSITISGNATQDIYYHITPSGWELPDGIYILTDEVSPDTAMLDHSNYRIYFEGFFEDKSHEILAGTDKPESLTFELKSEKYASIDVCLFVGAGYHEEFTIYPAIRSSTESSSFKSAVLTSQIDGTKPFQVFAINRAVYESLSEDEERVMINNLITEYQGEYLWTSVVFDDGRGIQYIESDSEQIHKGMADYWGMIIN